MITKEQVDMVVRAGEHCFPCQVLHLNERGILARLLNGQPSDLYEGEEGVCLLNCDSEAFEGACQVLRIVRNVVALTFSDLDILQRTFIQKLAEIYN